MAREGFPVAAAARLPGVLLRLGLGFLRLQRLRKRGVRTFEVALRSNGVSPTQAAKLGHRYYEAASIREIVAGLRRS